MSKISIIGSGGMASAIGGLASRAGHIVEVMSRDRVKSQALAGKIGNGATAAAFGTTPAGDIVILAVPYAVALEVVKQYGDGLVGKLIIDITNPVAPDLKSFATPPDSLGAQEIARAAPADVNVVKAFNTHFSHILAAGSLDRRLLDVFIAGDNEQAKARVSAFVESMGLRSLDVGQLAMARTLEHMCLLSLGLIARSIKHTNFAIGVSLPS